MAADKRRYAGNGDVLGDTLKYRHLWEQAGGVFIHHASAAETIRELCRIGLLSARPAAAEA